MGWLYLLIGRSRVEAVVVCCFSCLICAVIIAAGVRVCFVLVCMLAVDVWFDALFNC